MNVERRAFLANAGSALATLCTNSAAGGTVHSIENSEDEMGVLVDMTQCIGCRLCEYACKHANGIEAGALESYDDQSVFVETRKTSPTELTIINAWPPTGDITTQPSTAQSDDAASQPATVFSKFNCLHCRHPACVSACIVGALEKQPGGAVTYEAWKCIGCRYCMVACPFQVPKYEYEDTLTPRVVKCEFCAPLQREGKAPACVTACPRQVMQFGPREELLEIAHRRIAEHPGKFVNHVYGEHEAGGTSWLYLSPVPHEQAGLVKIGATAPPMLTESIQHGVFKYGLPPMLLYGALGATMFLTRRQGISKTQDVIVDDPAAEPAHHVEHEEPAPVKHTLKTPGVAALTAFTIVGIAFALYRFIASLAAATNLSQDFPWGLWIAVDVASGVALAAGGFTTAFLGHVLHRKHYHAILRPALLTAALGYTFVVLGLQADLGRYYNVWHPVIMWQGNSVLFEVGMCVMAYLTVLYLEFAPIICERLMRVKTWPRTARFAAKAHRKLERGMFLLVIAGCVLSCLHQSSLGNLMVIAPTKMHMLWWTPISPLLFLMSAIAVGFPMVIWESLLASWSLKLRPETELLSKLARLIPFTLGAYLIAKVADITARNVWPAVVEGSLQSFCWIAEMLFGVIAPLLIFASPKLRQSRGWLFTAATLTVAGVIFNRVNVFIIGYMPPFAHERYVPSIAEFAVTIGLIACLMLIYRLCVTYLPVISHKPGEVK